MSDIAGRQLDAIHAMLAAGQRNLRMERHSLILWGVAGGLLFAISDLIFTHAEMPDEAQRGWSWLLLISAVLGTVGFIDWQLTRRVKRAKDEVWSFVHRQIMKVWWLLMGMGTLLTFAMFFFGGGDMLCAAWLVLLGVGLYVHGLFSDETLEWVGGAGIVIGVAGLATGQPWSTMKWLGASAFGVGLPVLAFMLNERPRPTAIRLASQTVTWVLLVLAPPLVLLNSGSGEPSPQAPVMSLESFRHASDLSGPRVVSLPAGTAIPVVADMSGRLFGGDNTRVVLPLTLAEPVEVAMVDGKLTGQVRYAGGAWASARDLRWLRIPWLRAELTQDQGPVVRTGLVINMQARSR